MQIQLQLGTKVADTDCKQTSLQMQSVEPTLLIWEARSHHRDMDARGKF